MSLTHHLRRIVFASGVTAVMMSVLLDGHFATDITAVPVPGPTPLALLAIAGVAGIVGSLIRRRRK